MDIALNLPAWWLANRWLAWGVGPIVAANVGTWPMGLFLNWYTRQAGVAERLVTWKGSKGSRKEDYEATFEKVPYISQQILGRRGALSTILGPNALVGGLISALVLDYRSEGATAWPALTLGLLVWQVAYMYIVGDFWLYWGHRLQHAWPYAYEHWHSVHHSIDTPTALGAIYIHPVDATLQASLPMFFAALQVGPHPLSFYCYVCYRIAENILNHGGLDGSFLDFIFLKFSWLGRASASHHDSHHKFGGRSSDKPMNLGEGFWVWDWMFGTYSARESMRAGAKE
jgi:sterol desaturase/sphingolipid hydroxylase (fatty acid hydroxylase superfamily)